MDDAPLVIGGTGGSGTRAVARIFQRSGWFLGERLNGSQDALGIAEFDWRWGAELLSGGITPAMRDDFERVLAEHLADRPDGAIGWGWKHPQSYLMLPLLAERFPGLRFIHVVRDGRDVALGKNQNQAALYGDLALGDQGDPADPVRRIRFWAWANQRAADEGERLLGERSTSVRLEDLCSQPVATVERLLDFAGGPRSDPLPVEEVHVPETLGRGSRAKLGIRRRLDEAAGPVLRRFGYDSPLPLTTEQVRTEVASYDRWHYAIDLPGVRTPIHDARLVNRHEQRRRYFFDRLVEVCGGSLEGRRVLDLGCNAGFWSLCAIEAGAESVLGLDARPVHVEQAELVFAARGVDLARYAFRIADVFTIDLEEEAPFDIVLCLGLLYHVGDPLGLVRRLGGWSSDLIVIDTSVSTAPGAMLELRREPTEDPRNAIGSEFVLRPTRRAVVDLVAGAGFQVLPLRPGFTSYDGAQDYEDGRRMAFLCAKHTRIEAS